MYHDGKGNILWYDLYPAPVIFVRNLNVFRQKMAVLERTTHCTTRTIRDEQVDMCRSLVVLLNIQLEYAQMYAEL